MLKKYLIEREIPGVGEIVGKDLCAAAGKSNAALAELGKDIQWVESFVTADKTFCVYLASSEEIIRKHAEISGFPANKITEVVRMIDPTTQKS